MKYTFLIGSLVFLVITIGIAVFTDTVPEHKTDVVSQDQRSDEQFISGMIVHHSGAIAMADQAKLKSKRAEIQELASAIIVAQTQENEELYAWRKQWFDKDSHLSMTEDTHDLSMVKDLGLADDEFDKRFLEAMIAHHQGALQMAENVQDSKRQEVQAFANRVIENQTKEIQLMNQWLDSWYGQK